MKYRDDALAEALAYIANGKDGWQTNARTICARAMYRITELENAWDKIRDASKRAHEIAQAPDDEFL